ncbi:Prephenate dehydratase-domain-containing protein [Sporodiniella umbellata]|nr:Prephenate dehydratase-domain-containing protein [Sporodiniella umbellata]
MSDLPSLRKKIDSLDTTLVNILNERARVSLDIGAAKKEAIKGTPEEHEESNVHVYRPGREKEIYEKLSRLNQGPLNNDSLHAIFREIMSASIALQKDVSIAYLGPLGTFSHQAAFNRFGDSVAYVPQKQICDIFDAVERGITTYGIVPFENSTFGTVVETLDRFISSNVKVRAETYLTVHQSLLSNSPLEKITKVYSHPQGIGQTQKWLSTHVPHARRIPVKSTAEAAEKAALETGAAAVCSEICGELYGLEIIKSSIEDGTANNTRFLVIGSASDAPTKDDHTLITFTVDHRQPGALCDGLKVFKDYGLNLFKIDSRPNGQRPWHFVFFVECSGHFENEQMQKALKDLHNYCLDIVVLGSFPNQRPE